MSSLPYERTEQNSVADASARHLKSAFAVGLLLLIGAGGIAAYGRILFDYPIVLFIDRFANRSATLDAIVSALTRLDLLKGVLLVAGVYYLWFAAPELQERARLLAGSFAAAAAGLVSRLLQLVLPTHPRPLHDPALHFVRPTWVRVDTLNNWDSFPSDHASLLFALAMAIWVVRPRVGVAAFIWALLLCVGRVYCGFHFPSDIVGGIGLGVLVVCIAQLAFIRKLCCGVIRCASKWTPSVCAIAFIAAYLTATMFDDIRSVGKGITKLAPFYTHSAAITDGGYPSAGVTAAWRP